MALHGSRVQRHAEPGSRWQRHAAVADDRPVRQQVGGQQPRRRQAVGAVPGHKGRKVKGSRDPQAALDERRDRHARLRGHRQVDDASGFGQPADPRRLHDDDVHGPRRGQRADGGRVGDALVRSDGDRDATPQSRQGLHPGRGREGLLDVLEVGVAQRAQERRGSRLVECAVEVEAKRH